MKHGAAMPHPLRPRRRPRPRSCFDYEDDDEEEDEAFAEKRSARAFFGENLCFICVHLWLK
jgi:hypothetical protein